ncbi:eukaryotic translation initiation factor 4 gamma 3-like [Pollicipes pollicipes]|uniref:eukaryotic translation initiation factor 4 gamma 3-like n=1 Tax=Pollicipes pollicipes TaxID=41117 RepID=UPI001884DEE8|nr:eukaryotic translation initiation factor 4 gamma 3-like [Pollicipes pollicipes]
MDGIRADLVSLSGKTQYGREDLLRLQHCPLSQRRPAALPDLPSIVRRDRSAPPDPRAAMAAFKSRSMGGNTEFLSGFKPAVGPPGKYRGRGSGQGRRDTPQQGPPPPRRIEISLNRDVKLRTTDNAWKPSKAAADTVDEADAEMAIIRALKGILNKITPSNIERQIENIRKLEVKGKERLANMINVLFDKAVDEPAYASQYATVCVAMAKFEVDVDAKEGKPVTFRKLLLTKCQEEFEKDKSLGVNREARQLEIEAQTDPALRREKAHALAEEERRVRLRSNGNIRFIGELYKLGMLTDRIMQQCIVKLLHDKHEDSYECLTKLVTTIGQKLEKAEQTRGKNLSPQFDEFRRLSTDKALSSRVRFMLQDLIELRANSWVSTRAAGQPRPMTIEEVHEQARRQAAEQQVALAQAEDRRARAIVGEFLENGDIEVRDGRLLPASMEDCETHLHEATLSTFVAQCLDVFVDARSSEQRHAAGQLHRLLLERGLLTPAIYLAGAGDVLDAAVDLATDVPAIWTNLAQLLAPALLRLRALVPHDLDWALFFGEEDPARALKEAPKRRGLRALLSAIRADGELARWLEANCSSEDRRNPGFVTDLVSAIAFNAIVIEGGALRVSASRLERFAELLRAELDTADRELTAVNSVQTLAEHLGFPTGLLDQLLRQLHDLEAVPEAAFRRWRDSADPEGEGVVAASMRAFFQALDAAGEEEPRV